MKLTEDTYYSPEANLSWVDCSTFKNFVGTPSKKPCEARALALAKGEYFMEKSVALLQGSYVDEALTGDIGRFKRDNPQLFSSRGPSKGELKSDYVQAQAMVDRARRDDFFMSFMEGEFQKIMTAEIAGVPVRIKMDVFNGNRIVDLKTTRDIYALNYAVDYGRYLDFIQFFGYTTQAAFYQEVVRQNTGEKLPFYIAAISKNQTNHVAVPRLAVIQVSQQLMDEELENIKMHINSVKMILDGDIEPIPCGECDYCATEYDLDHIMQMDELYGGAEPNEGFDY